MQGLSKNVLMLLSVLSLSLTSCKKPPDVPVCEHLEQWLSKDPTNGHLVLKPSPKCMKEIGEVECGHCTYIVSRKVQYVGEKPETFLKEAPEKPWSQLRRESVLIPAKESYAPLSAFMINMCKRTKCDKEVEKFKVKDLTVIGEE